MVSGHLEAYQPITLEEMDKSRLMDRIDRKFCFHVSLLPGILTNLTSSYRILEIGGHRVCHYRTVYFDTDLFAMYAMHHNGKMNRFKVRHRTYVESELGFMEVKRKNNKGRTIKNRIRTPDLSGIMTEEAGHFVDANSPFHYEDLKPSLQVDYSRICLVKKTGAERITLDLQLKYDCSMGSRSFDTLVIAEVKQDRRDASPFTHLMRNLRVREARFSKYAMGIAMLYPDVKSNNFKEQIHTLMKITHDNSHITANT